MEEYKYSNHPHETRDVEATYDTLLTNDNVSVFSWSDISVHIKSRTDKSALTILEKSSGFAKAGEFIALMGPSGSGKTTLLNVLAGRSQSPWHGSLIVNGEAIQKSQLRQVSCYVEQEDALIGSLTVRETIEFAARLSSHALTRAEKRDRVDSLIQNFGLSEQADTIIGTALRKGISGGQKRRVSVASQLVTSPQILFLDEPTSGLDSTASHEVMSYIRQVAKRHKLIVIASIHQPSTSTFHLFDKVLLLARGSTCYFGTVREIPEYFEGISQIPTFTNPAEFLLDLVNDTFQAASEQESSGRVSSQDVIEHWRKSPQATVQADMLAVSSSKKLLSAAQEASYLKTSMILLHRNFIKSYRDFLAYGTRIVMYIGLAIMMGTVWLRLPYTQASISSFISGLFFSGAFMSFMAVAYVPSVIEDLQNLRKEYANGLYGAVAFILANFLVGVPWLALITLSFSIITYWLCNFTNTASGFWQWTLWLFLDLLAAESLVVLLSSLFPVFVVALAAAAFANGLWMSVGGFLVPLGTLNVFWKYVFHYIDYQAYVFQAMMVNQFKHTTYTCDRNIDGTFFCMYPSSAQSQGLIDGKAVLDRYQYSYQTHKVWEWFGIMIAIILVHRVLSLVILSIKLRGSGR